MRSSSTVFHRFNMIHPTWIAKHGGKWFIARMHCSGREYRMPISEFRARNLMETNDSTMVEKLLKDVWI